MKKYYFLLMILSFSIGLFGQTKLNVKDYLLENKEAYVKIKVDSKQEIAKINASISVDLLDENHVAVYVTPNNLDKFLDLGYDYEILTPPSKLFVPQMFDGSKAEYEWDTYPTYEAYIAMMEQFAVDYPEICEVFSIGESEEGRELKFVKISDNVGTREAEPQFMYTGTMHGDETAGYVSLIRLIDYLASNYGTDEEVNMLVDNLEIWINPAANPDGTYSSGNHTVWGATRNNANGVNLNRNYADPEDGPHPDGNEYQAETEAFMALAEANDFVMSANTHGGAEVVNYPWDTWAQLSADDDWWVMVSREFADTCHAYAPASYMNGFDNGITNGYAWYSIDGGRQDYMNYFHHCREVTLELSDVKLLPESELDNHWNYNHRAFINYMKQCLYGVKGIVTDSITGEPLEAKVEILGHDEDESHVFSDVNGFYSRLLKGDSYDITFSKEGYFPKTIEDVVVEDFNTTLLDVQLVSAALLADFTADQQVITLGDQVQFSENCYGDVESYVWAFEGGSPSASSDANPLVTYNEEGEFDVSLTIYSGTDSQTITKQGFIRVSEMYTMENGEITTCSGIFLDNGGMDGNYTDNQDLEYTIYGSQAADEAILTVDFVEFNVEDHASCDYDYLKIYNGASTSGELIGTYCGTNSPGFVEADNEDNALTFVFHSDGSVNESGWKASIGCTIIDDIAEMDLNQVKIYPNPNVGRTMVVEAKNAIEHIIVYNLAGQKLKTFTTSQTKEILELGELNQGVYLVSVHTEAGIEIQKITLQ